MWVVISCLNRQPAQPFFGEVIISSIADLESPPDESKWKHSCLDTYSFFGLHQLMIKSSGSLTARLFLHQQVTDWISQQGWLEKAANHKYTLHTNIQPHGMLHTHKHTHPPTYWEKRRTHKQGRTSPDVLPLWGPRVMLAGDGGTGGPISQPGRERENKGERWMEKLEQDYRQERMTLVNRREEKDECWYN